MSLPHNNHHTNIPIHLDFLVERLKTYDVTELCDLLDIDSEDLLRKFMDRVHAKREYLASELELLIPEEDSDNEDSGMNSDTDGFQYIEPGDTY